VVGNHTLTVNERQLEILNQAMVDWILKGLVLGTNLDIISEGILIHVMLDYDDVSQEELRVVGIKGIRHFVL